jgi:single-stranded-DNA-specific exonuclease
MRWNKEEIDKQRVREIADQFGIDLLTASILVRREVLHPEEIKFFLEDDLSLLHNPFLFVEMEDAVDRIRQAAEEGEKVRIYGDRDVDGITSTVILVDTLTGLDVDVSWALPQGDESYGLSMKAVDEFAAEDGSLLITVDCGISNVAEIEYAAEKGIDTIVLDHHNPQPELPGACAIIDPKLEDSGYPFRDLAGCGVVAKLVWALAFSKSEFYKHPVCLLNIRPANDSYIVEAVKLVNQVEIDRVSETLIPGMVRLQDSPLFGVLSGCAIFVYDEPLQLKMFKKVFGEAVELHLADLAPEISEFAGMNGRSLLQLREKSKLKKYSSADVGEIDILIALFCTVLDKKQPWIMESLGRSMDLVALGTIADLMPLRDENRVMVRLGLAKMHETYREGLRELLFQQNLAGKRLSTTDIGWKISPVLNATGRMGVPDKAARLLLTTEREERLALSGEVLALNKERKKMGEKIWQQILPAAKRSYADLHGKLVLVGHKSVPRGITGIIASRLVNSFNVPSIVVALMDDVAIGSVRSMKGFNAKDFLEQFGNLFLDYGGHDYAAGFSMERGRYEEFIQTMIDRISDVEAMEQREASLDVDAELPLKYLTPELTALVERFEPYGEENPPLLFLVRGVRIAGLDLMGKGEQRHVRLTLDSGEYKWPSVYWNAADRVGRDFDLHDRVDVVFRLGRNYYQNKETLQLTIMDIAR